MNVLRRPIHPEPGNASMAMAARLATLYGYGQTNGFSWPTDYSAKTIIQGEPMQIPWKTRAEAATGQVDPHGGANPKEPKPGVGTDEGDSSLRDELAGGGVEGTDISLTSETGKQMANGDTLDEDTMMTLTINVYMEDPRTPVIGDIGAKNVYTKDVGEALHKFDTDRKHKGTEFAFRELFTGPCSTFKIALDDIVAHVKAQIFSPADVEKIWAKLPGVVA
jgi:hypothetical protein